MSSNNNNEQRRRARRQASQNIDFRGQDGSRDDARDSIWRGQDEPWRNASRQRINRTPGDRQNLPENIHTRTIGINQERDEQLAARAREEFESAQPYHRPAVTRRETESYPERTYCGSCRAYMLRLLRCSCGKEVCYRCHSSDTCRFCSRK